MAISCEHSNEPWDPLITRNFWNRRVTFFQRLFHEDRHGTEIGEGDYELPIDARRILIRKPQERQQLEILTKRQAVKMPI
jgi:hypothetical protein